jgi:hypothetical protein
MTDYVKGDPWFDDGNIIVLSEDATAFKVHRGVLARQSEVFETMFGLPQPESVDIERVEGCPVVRMYDHPSELGTLLKAIYDGM